MKTKLILLLLLIGMVAVISCKKNELSANPTIVSPINGLILTVNGVDYTASPKLLNNQQNINDTLLLTVVIPSPVATVKQITLGDPTATCNISKGATATFINNILPITVTSGGSAHTYYVKMNYNPPPFMYFIKTSDKSASGGSYFLNTATAQKLASANYNTQFEGYIDLTGHAWDNTGLIQSDLTSYFDYNGGWYPQQSSGKFTLTSNTSPGTGYFSCTGPWADWGWTNKNAAIISPGVWKLNYDASTMILNLVETQWAVNGSATGGVQALTYSPAKKLWTITASLSSGDFLFTTVPVTTGDPTVSYNELSSTVTTGYLSTKGTNIKIATAGSYTITLNLSNPPYYTYQVVKN